MEGSNKKKKSSNWNEQTLGYYKRVSETLKEGFPSENDKELFLNNIFSQLVEEVVPVCKHFITSCIVEDLLATASLSNLKDILLALYENREFVCSNRYSSHVLQTLLCLLPKFIARTASNYSANTDNGSDIDNNASVEAVSDEFKVIRLVLRLCDYIEEHLQDCLKDAYASHVLRAVLQLLGGMHVDDRILRSRGSRNRKKEGDTKETIKFPDFSVPSVFQKTLKRLIKSTFQLDNFALYLTDPSACPVILTLLVTLHKADDIKCQKYLKKIVKKTKIEDSLDKLAPIVTDRVGSFLIEQVISLSSLSVLTKLYNGLFQGKLLQFALNPTANFILQSFIKRLTEKEMFEEVCDELCSNLEDILGVGHFGIAVSLAEACLRIGTRQEKLKNTLMGAFHCLEPVERQTKVVPVIASLSTYEVFYQVQDVSPAAQAQEAGDQKLKVPILTQVNYHGSLLVQTLLKFGNPRLVVTSFMEMKPVELKNLSCDACGSHVIETFFKSTTVGEKNRDALLNRMKGLYVDLACDKHGSRALESIWKSVKTKQKSLIAEELCKHEDKVRGNKFGFFVHRNFALRHFSHRQKDWQEWQGAAMKKRKMFQDILDPASSQKKHKSGVPEADNTDSGSEEEAASRLTLKDDEQEGDWSVTVNDMFKQSAPGTGVSSPRSPNKSKKSKLKQKQKKKAK